MLKNIVRTSALLLSFFAFSAYANVAITTVTNQQSATNGCTVNSIGGGYNFVIWGVNCPSENGKIVYIQTSWNPQYGSCTATSVTTGYWTSSSCTNYTVYRSPASSSSSAASSSSASCTTQYINIGMTCNGGACSESFGRTCYAAGGTTVVEGGYYSCRKTVCQ